MELIIGFLLCLILVIAFTLGIYIGSQYNKTINSKTSLNDGIREQKRKQKGFDNIMNYDVNVAMGITEQMEE